MMVLFVSQCEKRALKRTRRVLDTFAERIGDNTWRTVITAEGLKAVRKLLQKTATKSTAVSCHWIRSRHRSDLLWIVGNKNKFNHEGVVPVHRTSLPLLEAYKEHDWHYLGLIQSLAAVAALLHDWGKANADFQKKLHQKTPISDPLRHEWVSVILLGTFIGLDPDSWLQRLAEGRIEEKALLKALQNFKFDHFVHFPFSAQAVAWLILTHHKLPFYTHNAKKIRSDWGGEPLEEFEIFFIDAFVNENWGYRNGDKPVELRFPKGVLEHAPRWIDDLKRWSRKLLNKEEELFELQRKGNCRIILHHARVALMLGDYGYSSAEADVSWQTSCDLFANTRPDGTLKQYLDEHLCGVCRLAQQTAYRFPYLENALPKATGIRTLLRPSPKEFVWQDKAAKTVWESYGKKGLREGFFAVNLASTGKGKTIANAKVMQSLHKDRALRYVLALGLRTLTLQTGDEYRHRIGLDDEQMAVVIGSRAMVQLHDDAEKQMDDERDTDTMGSESSEPLVREWVDFDDGSELPVLSTVLRKAKERAILYAPVLVATIDHIMGAVDSPKGGGHLLPSLRLLGSDLVIDEIDDFAGSDLIAIGRLVHLAGMLGRRVMISSATIPPDLAEGYFHAYASGWKLYAATREVPNRLHAYWIDEFSTDTIVIANDEKATRTFAHRHERFIRKRIAKLQNPPPKRKAIITPIDAETHSEKHYFEAMWQAMRSLHNLHHILDPKTGKRISFGVVRMANISPCVEMARFLCHCKENGTALRVMAYHSNQVLLLRHAQERYLDTVLKRKEKAGESPAAFFEPLVRRHIDACESEDLIFVVVATPVEEVGRDHDFDWALIEPSSWRSVIQMAGRVMRHRERKVAAPNVAIMRYNLKAWKENDRPGKAYFVHPGFESTEMILNTHDMNRLVDTDAIKQRLDAAWRIAKPQTLHPEEKLVDLEHFVMQEALTRYEHIGPDRMEGWLEGYWYLTGLPLIAHRFRTGQASYKCFLHYDEKASKYRFVEFDQNGTPINREKILGIRRCHLDTSSRFWLHRDYDALVEEEAMRRNLSKEEITRRFGELSFTSYDDNETLYYCDQLGLFRKK